MLTRDLVHVPGAMVHRLVDYTLDPTDTGTVLTMAAAHPRGFPRGVGQFRGGGAHHDGDGSGSPRVFKELVEVEVAMLATSSSG